MKNYTSSVDFDNLNDNSIEILNENDNKKVNNSIRKIRLKKNSNVLRIQMKIKII